MPDVARRGFRCPFCKSDERPEVRSQISTGGWVVFAALLLVCPPLFFVGLLMKEEYRVCADCGSQVSG